MLRIEKIFEDKYSGGGDFMDRPAMKELLDYVDQNAHKKYIIIFDDIKRMARDVEFHLKLRRVLRSLDIIPFSPNYEFGDTPEAHLMEVVAAVQGDVERKQNRRQVIQKQTARLQRGYWSFGAIKGYTQERDAVHGNLLTPNEPDFSLIKESLEGFASGRFQTQQDACNFLTKSEYKGKGKKIYPTHFKERLAKQILYTGYVEYQKWEVSRRKGHHKAAISLETFEKIQKKLKDNGRPHYRTTTDEDFPLRGFLNCGLCKVKFTASWSTGRNGKSHPYYKCRNKNCEVYGKSMNRKEVHLKFDEVLNMMSVTDETVGMVKEVFLEKWEERMKEKDKDQIFIEKEFSKIEGNINHYLEMAAEATSDAIRKRYEKKADDLINHQQVLEQKSKEKPRDKGHVVIVQLGSQQIAFVVDSLVGQEEVVIKPLDRLLHGTPGMAGATITSDGGIALILDVPNMLKYYAKKSSVNKKLRS